MLSLLSLRLSVAAVVIFLAVGCGSKPTDPRTIIPADSLVYLESQDAGAALSTITDNEKFRQLAESRPDLSALNGVKIGIGVTGFEASEQPVTDESSVLNLQPLFVAAIETNAWGWQTKSFVEHSLGEFVNEAYGGAIELEVTTRNDGEYYVWTSPEGQKAYALQQGSLVLFSNTESAIERCHAVKRGESASVTAGGKIPEGDFLAAGFISPDGVAQIANLVGIQLAKGTGEEADVQSFIARVLPEILRNSVKEITWTATRSEQGVVDKYAVTLDDESARVASETIVPATNPSQPSTAYAPEAASTATRYLLRDPRIAWRSVVLTAQKKTDATSGSLIASFSGSIFEPYGVEDAEVFLGGVGSEIVTVKMNAESEDAAVIAVVKDEAAVRRAVASEIKLSGAPEENLGARIWKSEDGEFAAAFAGDVVVLGDSETVVKCLEAKQSGANAFARHGQSDAVAWTVANEIGSLEKLVEALTPRKVVGRQVKIFYVTETRFDPKGIQRHTTSDFGLLGAIIERLIPE